MKKNAKKLKWIFITVIMLISLLLFQASAEESYSFTYEVNGDSVTATVTGTDYKGENLVIPAVIDGYKVTQIGEKAFYDADSFVTVTLPQGIASIGEEAFYSCSSLKSVNIPDSVTTICQNAFVACGSLYEVNVPDSVVNVAYNMFPQSTVIFCTRFSEVGKNYVLYNDQRFIFTDVPDSWYTHWGQTGDLSGYLDRRKGVLEIKGSGKMPDYSSSGAPWYEYAYTVTSLKLDEGLENIGRNAFAGCYRLSEITLPESVTVIGDNSFNSCYSAAGIKFPESLEKIGNGAFVSCRSLKSIALPDSVVSVGENAFYSCKNLLDVSFPSSLTSLGAEAFSYCYSLETVTLPQGIVSVGEKAFSYCDSLKSISVPSSVKEMGKEVFYECTALENVTLSEGLATLGKMTFGCCTSLKAIVIPQSMKVIPDTLFYACTALADVVISEGVTEIGYCAFSNCKSLKSINIPHSVTSLGDYAFVGCSSLEEFTVPESVTAIGEGTFDTCISLKNIKLSDSLTSIGKEAFNNCDSLIALTVPENVTNVDDYAFSNCDNLGEIIWNAKEAVCGKEVFLSSGSENGMSVVFGDSAVKVPRGIFENVKTLKSITFGLNLEEIEMNAFYGCTGVTDIFWNAKSLWYDSSTQYDSFGFADDTKSVFRYIGDEGSGINVVFGDSVEYITDRCLSGCNVKTVAIGKNVERVGESIFDSCQKLTTLTVNGKDIYFAGFNGCYVLENIYWNAEKGWTSGTAFSGVGVHTDGARFYFSEGVKEIPRYLFDVGGNIKYIYLPSTLQVIREYAFNDIEGAQVEYNGTQAQWDILEIWYNNNIDKSQLKFLVAHTHSLKRTVITPATFDKKGKANIICTTCTYYSKEETIPYVSTVKRAATAYYSGKNTRTEVTVKNKSGKYLEEGKDYKLSFKGNSDLGSAKVTVTLMGDYSGSKTLDYTVKLAKPTSLKATQTDTSIKLSWDKVTGAKGYEIYIYNSKNKLQYTKKTTKRNYTFKKLKSGTSYIFKVRAYGKSAGKTVRSVFSSTFKTTTTPSSPTLTVTSGAKTANLKWTQQTGSNGYMVYMSSGKNGKYKKISTLKGVKNLSYKKKKLKTGKTYYFKVRAYKKMNKKSFYSPYSSIKSVKVK